MTAPAGVRAVAVEAGADGTRVAVRDRDGRVEPVSVLPGGTTVTDALDALLGLAPVPSLLLVHPASEPRSADAVVAALAGRADVVRAVAAPVAVLALPTGAVRADSRAPCVVLDVGRVATELAVVRDGRVVVAERVPTGGDDLDAALADRLGWTTTDARTAREALSGSDSVELPDGRRLSAEDARSIVGPVWERLVARAADTARRHDASAVLLVGGAARTPAPATLLDRVLAGTGCVVRVLPEPGTAAVLGALRWSDGDRETGAPAPDPESDPGPAGRGAAGGARRGRRRPRLPALVAVLGLVLVVAGVALGRPSPAGGPVAAATLVQYGYATDLPAGWEHTGGDPAHRRTVLTRAGAPDGVELLSVERSPLGYDSTLEPGRARTELARQFTRSAAVRGLDELRADVVAGRSVLRYRQRGPASAVDWYVLFTGPDELVVGCRHPASGPSPAVTAACAAVVGSVRVLG